MNPGCIIDSAAYKKVALTVAVAMAIFQIIVAGYSFITINMCCAIHLAFAMTLVSILKPARFKNNVLTDAYNISFTLVAIACGLFLTYETRAAYALVYTLNGPTRLDVVVGSIIILLVLTCARRTTGYALPIICIIFLGYAVWGHMLPGLLTHKQYTWRNIVDIVVFTSEGLFGQPLSVSSSYVASFILFGAFLEATGAGQWFIDMAYALTGRYRNGPAMTAVVSSAAMGTISGTGVANVVTTGTFTIPLMKSCGYSPTMAGAVEATASTGGQIMPPVMGAGAFILAEMIGMPYGTVVVASILPSLLFFLAVAFQVDFEAGKLGMKGLPKEQLPAVGETFKTGVIFLIPVVILIWAMCIVNYSINYSALYAIASIIVIGFFLVRKELRLSFGKIIEALASAAKDMAPVAMACAVAGLMIGILTKTGLGLKFTSLLLSAGGDMKLLTMMLTMCCCIILGMGLPTTAAFIITATLCAPALVQLGISTLGAYLFVFYYACLSAITPPVALAAFAAAGISGGKPVPTAMTATRLGIAGFVIPYFFCFTPAMLLQGTALEIVRVSVGAVIGIYFLAAGLEGYMWKKLGVVERGLLIVAALLLVDGGLLTDIAGIVLGGAIVGAQFVTARKRRLAE